MRFFALVPAAGTGSRMGGELPKQYLRLGGRPLIYHALAALCEFSAIARVFVVLNQADRHFERYDWSGFRDKLAPLYCGGETRAQTVANGLAAIRGEVGESDWVLVHDAARPCLDFEMLDRLIGQLGDDAVGGLLALPVADTLKRGDEQGRVQRTESRDGLWAAQTPQMFRHSQLLDALQNSAIDPTDEAGAIEAIGLAPKLVMGDPRNFKVTYPRDLELAEMILKERKRA